MKRIFITIVSLVLVTFNSSAQCNDISPREVVTYLNREIKPTLDLKLDKEDGFLAIKRQRQNLKLRDVSYKRNKLRKVWKYSFQNVRRVDNNFFYDSDKNLFALDVKFESDGPEIKGICPGCYDGAEDRRAPDIEWTSVQILRMYLKPVIYHNSISFHVEDIKFIGEFKANGLGGAMPALLGKIHDGIKPELQRVFSNGQTQRLFNNALIPLLDAKNIRGARSVSLASSSLRICR